MLTEIYTFSDSAKSSEIVFTAATVHTLQGPV